MLFNSLGSNYSLTFTLQATLLALTPWRWHNQAPNQQLKASLKQRFGGTVHLFYKGRHAITFILQTLGLGKDDQVLTQAFTCWAVEEGITASGARPVFVDTADNSLNFSAATLEQALKRAPRAKAVFVQHTLGYPAPIDDIKKFCHRHQLYLIEDLAHAFGATDKKGRPLGASADAIILSFSRDKIIDGISGGAAVIKTKTAKRFHSPLRQLSRRQLFLDLTYPFLTFTIRSTYPFFIGKLLHWLFNGLGLLSSPISNPSKDLTQLSPPLASLIIRSLNNLDKNLVHRRQIAQSYATEMDNPLHLDISRSTNLRYPVLLKNRAGFLKQAKQAGFHLSDIWYKQSVDTGKSKKIKSSYQSGSCPNAESLSKQIINLPTHQKVTLNQAHHIVKLINQSNDLI